MLLDGQEKSKFPLPLIKSICICRCTPYALPYRSPGNYFCALLGVEYSQASLRMGSARFRKQTDNKKGWQAGRQGRKMVSRTLRSYSERQGEGLYVTTPHLE